MSDAPAETLTAALADHVHSGRRSFHTPGHKGRGAWAGLSSAYDLTELPGLDELSAPTAVLLATERRAAQVFGADETFFLVNGATCGNQALLMVVAADQPPGAKILVERQTHRSLTAALVLSGLRPEYIPAVIHPDFGLALGTDFGNLPDFSGYASVHLTAPTYFGTMGDYAPLYAGRDAADRLVPILADSAHGAHFLSALFPPSPLSSGADAVVHGTHKTLGSLTQSGMLHLRGTGLDSGRLKQALALLQTSSPSYLLLASLERASQQALNTTTQENWARLREEVAALHHDLGDILRLLGTEDEGKYSIRQTDWSKILINLRPLACAAPPFVTALRERGIEPELWDEENILFLLGTGSLPEDVKALGTILLQLVSETHNMRKPAPRSALPPLSAVRLTPREAWFAAKEQIPLREAEGRTAAETIAPIPPGVPLVVAGEEITYEVREALSQWLRGCGRTESLLVVS
jgi:arginine/lysine/ornithine decarboxylase